MSKVTRKDRKRMRRDALRRHLGLPDRQKSKKRVNHRRRPQRGTKRRTSRTTEHVRG